MIISASRRTDIPAFYPEWLRQRLDAGFCTVPNPFNLRQVARVSLRREDVDAIIFWTRDARPLLPLLPILQERGYRFYFQYTLTGYGPPLEPDAPPIETATATMQRVAATHAVVWRFDPILLGPAVPHAERLERFARIAAALEGSVRQVVVSVVHLYRKTIRRLGVRYRWGDELSQTPTADPALPDLLGSLVEIADRHGMVVQACSQAQDLSHLGIVRTKCIDDRLLAELFGGDWPSGKDPGQRPECRCVPSRDIGMNDTCGFGCLYCYATVSEQVARRRLAEHDPTSPSLHGRHEPTATQLCLL